MQVTLYFIPQLQVDKPQTIRFENFASRTAFFNSITLKTTPNYMGNDWQEFALYNEITVAYTDLGANPYNYVKLTEKSTQEHYYYVIGHEQVGNTQTILKLKKDTFMTHLAIPSNGINLAYKPSLVIREHKPRFDYTLNTILIDEFLENNNNTTPKIYSETAIGSTRKLRLVYRNRSSDWKPVAYVYTSTSINLPYIGDDWVGNITPSLENSDYYVWSGNYQYTFGTGTPNVSVTDDWVTYYHILSSNISGQWVVSRINKTTGVITGQVVWIPAGATFKIKLGTTTTNKMYYVPSASYTWSFIESNYQTLNNQPSGTAATPTFEDIDIYDPNNERIVEIPYLDESMTFRKDGQGLYVTLDENNGVELTYSMPIIAISGFTSFDTSKTDKNRVYFNEPKLFSSQFSPRFLSFNGMVQGIKLEWINKDYGINNITSTVQLKPYFETSLIMPSLFNLKTNFGSGYTMVRSQIDEFIKRWTVNNEIAVVKDEAYTYNEYYRDLDDKSRKIAEDASLRNTALNVVNQGLNVVGGAFKPENTRQIAARAGQAGINIANTIIEHNEYLQQNMIKYNQKYIALQLSMSQISGASLDFLKSFNGDMLRIHQFGLRDRDLSYWDEVFYKYGYQTLEYKVPSLKTRKYFDYKQFVMDEYNQGWGLIDRDVFEDIRMRFAEGITIYHYDLATGFIDWQQTKENWEV